MKKTQSRGKDFAARLCLRCPMLSQVILNNCLCLFGGTIRSKDEGIL